LPYPLNWLW